MNGKKNLVLLFGGQSSEHEVSCVSAATVAGAVDRERWDLLLIGITKDGRWLKTVSVDDIASGAWRDSTVRAALLPDAGLKSVLIDDNGVLSLVRADVVFPVLHGLYGEDGCVQGLLELAQIPYVGCGVLSSAVTMDKATTKAIVARLGVAQAKYLAFRREEMRALDALCERIETELGYPVFVKPSNAGSSCGISKACNRGELEKALRLAAEHDFKIVVEEAIVGRELETAALGGWDARVCGVGEILATAEFYDYDAKYKDSTSRTVLNADLPAGKADEIREAAKKIYQALDCDGLSRVDFFLEKGTDRVIFNEINTIPGFTSISMYPKLWEAAGVPLPELVARLIESAAVTPHRQEPAHE
ncbi:MAG: D-alanine--D-alanine ligase [Pyramidobacter sp.]|nr:D-alanine--D-alanine ligase [Pyramidobacter sp.]